MAVNPQNLPSDRDARRLTRLYVEAQRTIIQQIELAVRSGRLQTARLRRLQLAAVLAYLDQIGAATDPLARQLVAQAVEDGARLADRDIRRLGATTTPVAEQAFAAVNQEAVQVATDALTGRLSAARQTVGRTVDDVFRRHGLEQTARALLGVEGSPQTASRRLARQLAAGGQTGFVDSAGRQWKLADYAQMAVRTTTRQAVVTGQVNRLASHNINLVEISRHASPCRICAPMEGRLIDLTGRLTEYRGQPVSTDTPLPPFHPNCRHTIYGVSVMADQARDQLAAGTAG